QPIQRIFEPLPTPVVAPEAAPPDLADPARASALADTGRRRHGHQPARGHEIACRNRRYLRGPAVRAFTPGAATYAARAACAGTRRAHDARPGPLGAGNGSCAVRPGRPVAGRRDSVRFRAEDRKSTRLNSSHVK